jgi:hypothetical protein
MLLRGWFIIVGALTVPLAADPQWRQFTPEDARFEISMPAEPIVAVQYVQDGKNVVRVNMASAHLDIRDEFLVSWTEYPKADIPSNYDRTFDKMRDALADAKNAKVMSERQVTLRGYHGRWITMRTDDDQVVDVIFYFTRSRVYQIMAHTPGGEEYKAQRARFLESFRLNSDA